MAKARRTTLRSSKGKKLYAVRNADGSFKDIQTYKRAHAADLRKQSKAEREAAASSKKAARKKKATRKPARQGARKATKRAARKKK